MNKHIHLEFPSCSWQPSIITETRMNIWNSTGCVYKSGLFFLDLCQTHTCGPGFTGILDSKGVVSEVNIF